MKEQWKWVGGYEGMYEVSNLGRIRSTDRMVRMVSKKGREFMARKKGRVLRQFFGSSGYLQVCFSKEGRLRTKMVHRLVVKAFLEPIEGKLEVNHSNGDKQNNSLENLEWCNSAENKSHAYLFGLRASGKEHHFAKLKRDARGCCMASNA
jgi:hypothetical protein